MNGAIGKWLGQRVVDEPVLLDERKPVERGRSDRHLEVVAAAGSVDDLDPLRVREPLLQQSL